MNASITDKDTFISQVPPHVNPVNIPHNDPSRKTNYIFTFFNVTKLLFGNLYMLAAFQFREVGYIGGPLLFILVALASFASQMMVIQLAEKKETQLFPVTSLTSLGLKIYGRNGAYLVGFCVFIMQYSVCCIFLEASFIYSYALIGREEMVTRTVSMWLTTVVVLPFCFIETYTALAYLSMIGVVMGSLSCIVVMYFCSIATQVPEEKTYTIFNIHKLFTLAGQIIFTFESNSVILNMRNEARTPQRLPRQVFSAYTYVTILFITLGLVGYVTFAQKTERYMIENIIRDQSDNGVPGKNVIILTTMLLINAWTSFPVQALPTFNIIETHRFYQDGSIKLKKILTRTFIVFMGTFVATLMQDLRLFIIIVGGLAASMVTFVLPCLMYLKEYGARLGLRQILVCYGLMLVGCACGIYTVISTVKTV